MVTDIKINVVNLMIKVVNKTLNSMDNSTMSFKQFKSLIEDQNAYSLYKGANSAHHVFFFDWKYDKEKNAHGFKYAIAVDRQHATKAEAFNAFHRWIFKEEQLPHYIRYKYAMSDFQRFKKPLSLDF